MVFCGVLISQHSAVSYRTEAHIITLYNTQHMTLCSLYSPTCGQEDVRQSELIHSVNLGYFLENDNRLENPPMDHLISDEIFF